MFVPKSVNARSRSGTWARGGDNGVTSVEHFCGPDFSQVCTTYIIWWDPECGGFPSIVSHSCLTVYFISSSPIAIVSDENIVESCVNTSQVNLYQGL